MLLCGEPVDAMTDHFSAPGIELYCADCREMDVKADLLLTDPPYGIGAASKQFRGSVKNGWTDYGHGKWDDIPADSDFLMSLIKASPESVIWGGNYFALPPSMGFLIWDKGQRDFSLADCEYAWRSRQCAARIFQYSRAAALKDIKEHPTQKPVALMAWCMEMAKATTETTVYDPYMGSGTTGIACIRTGRKFIGCEIDPTHFRTAVERIKRELDSPTFNFQPEPVYATPSML